MIGYGWVARHRSRLILLLAMCGCALPVRAQVQYSVEDGTAEETAGVGGPGTHDVLFLNRFSVDPLGHVITNIRIAFGSPLFPDPQNNGTPITILLYEDANGGTTTDAVLRASRSGVISMISTNTFVDFPITPTPVSGFFLVGYLARNQPAFQAAFGAIDFTPPHFLNTSFLGVAINPGIIDETNLGTVPDYYGTIEGSGLVGNWLIRATGIVPESSLIGALACLMVIVFRARTTTVGVQNPTACPSLR